MSYFGFIGPWMPGNPGPIPRCSLMVGGRFNGQRREFPVDWRDVRVPIPPKIAYYAAATLPPIEEVRVELYRWKTFRPCWAAAPIRLLVADGVEEDAAIALYQEWQ